VIPEHLAHLPQWRGLPVPYINRLGTAEERDCDWGIRYDRHLGEIAAVLADEPGGAPDFRHQCIQRQRECVLLGLCQVCKRALDWPDRRLVVSSVSVQAVDVEGRSVPVVTEPWLCPDCAEFASTTCPALIRRGHDEDLHVIEMSSPADCRIVLSRGWIEGRYETATKASSVAMWAKILLLNVAVRTRDQPMVVRP
jgi:hypothetical protein